MTQPSPSTVVVVGMLNSAMSQVKTYVDTTKMTQQQADLRYTAKTTPLQQLTGPTGALDMQSQRITGLGVPTQSTDAIPLGTADTRYFRVGEDIDLGPQKGRSTYVPVDPSDLCNKAYVDAHTGGGGTTTSNHITSLDGKTTLTISDESQGQSPLVQLRNSTEPDAIMSYYESDGTFPPLLQVGRTLSVPPIEYGSTYWSSAALSGYSVQHYLTAQYRPSILKDPTSTHALTIGTGSLQWMTNWPALMLSDTRSSETSGISIALRSQGDVVLQCPGGLLSLQDSTGNDVFVVGSTSIRSYRNLLSPSGWAYATTQDIAGVVDQVLPTKSLSVFLPPNSNLSMGGKKITSVAPATVTGDAVIYDQLLSTAQGLQTSIDTKVNVSTRLDQLTRAAASLDLNGQRIVSLANGTGDQDAVTKVQLDGKTFIRNGTSNQSAVTCDQANRITIRSNGVDLGYVYQPVGQATTPLGIVSYDKLQLSNALGSSSLYSQKAVDMTNTTLTSHGVYVGCAPAAAYNQQVMLQLGDNSTKDPGLVLVSGHTALTSGAQGELFQYPYAIVNCVGQGASVLQLSAGNMASAAESALTMYRNGSPHNTYGDLQNVWNKPTGYSLSSVTSTDERFIPHAKWISDRYVPTQWVRNVNAFGYQLTGLYSNGYSSIAYASGEPITWGRMPASGTAGQTTTKALYNTNIDWTPNLDLSTGSGYIYIPDVSTAYPQYQKMPVPYGQMISLIKPQYTVTITMDSATQTSNWPPASLTATLSSTTIVSSVGYQKPALSWYGIFSLYMVAGYGLSFYVPTVTAIAANSHGNTDQLLVTVKENTTQGTTDIIVKNQDQGTARLSRLMIVFTKL